MKKNKNTTITASGDVNTSNSQDWAVKRRHELFLTSLRSPSESLVKSAYTGGFRNRATNFFFDSPVIVRDINAGMYDKPKTWPQLVKRYNQWFRHQQAVKKEKESKSDDAK